MSGQDKMEEALQELIAEKYPEDHYVLTGWNVICFIIFISFLEDGIKLDNAYYDFRMAGQLPHVSSGLLDMAKIFATEGFTRVRD